MMHFVPFLLALCLWFPLMTFSPFVAVSIRLMSFLPPRLRRSQEFIASVLIFFA